MKDFNMSVIYLVSTREYSLAVLNKQKQLTTNKNNIDYCFLAQTSFRHPYRTLRLILSENTPDDIELLALFTMRIYYASFLRNK